MKKLIALIIAVSMALALTACTSSPTPSANVPTEAPVVTEAPTEAPEETAAPNQTEASEEITGIRDYCMPLQPDEEFITDLDCDGLEDTVLLRMDRKDEYDADYTIIVTRGADPDHPAEEQITNVYEIRAWVIDCDYTDSRLEVIWTDEYDSNDYSCGALRVADSGDRIVSFGDGLDITIDEDHPFTSGLGFYAFCRTEVLGTSFLPAWFTVSSDSFVNICDFSYGEDAEPMTLKRSITLKLLDDAGRPGEEITLNEGDSLTPYKTDLINEVSFMLDDGRLAIAELEVRITEDEFGVYLNGVNQDEYFDIGYSD
ncbi:MAG: hypothetical protein K6G56_00450 [Clostridiales bacterium]|nr:hypothetical protein [Clostridiales bacterium]